MKLLLLLFFFFLLLSACGGGNSSTEDNADTTVMTSTPDGTTVSFESTELTAPGVAELRYDLGGDEFTGTIRWGDGRESRIRGSDVARHGYDNAGTYSVSLQVDGGESNRIGVIVVDQEQETVDMEESTAIVVEHTFDGTNSPVAVISCMSDRTLIVRDAQGRNVGGVRSFINGRGSNQIALQGNFPAPTRRVDRQLPCIAGNTVTFTANSLTLKVETDGINYTLTLE